MVRTKASRLSIYQGFKFTGLRDIIGGLSHCSYDIITLPRLIRQLILGNAKEDEW